MLLYLHKYIHKYEYVDIHLFICTGIFEIFYRLLSILGIIKSDQIWRTYNFNTNYILNKCF